MSQFAPRVKSCCRFAKEVSALGMVFLIYLGFLMLLVYPLPSSAEEKKVVTRDVVNEQMIKGLLLIIENKGGPYSLAARIRAADTLGELGIEARGAIPDLVRVLMQQERSYPFRVDEALIRAVGKIGPPARGAIPALIRNAGLDRDLDRTITEAIDSILKGPQLSGDLASLIRLLQDVDPAERLKAAKSLATLGLDAREAAGELTLALNDTDPDVRRQALRALQAVRPGGALPPAAIAVLTRDLNDPDVAVRLRAAKTLVLAGAAARPALSALQAAARSDPDEDVRKVAGDALTRLAGDKQ